MEQVSAISAYVTSGQSGHQYVVNLQTKTCGCRIWDDQKVLCSHAIAFLSFLNQSPQDYIDPQYMVSKLVEFCSPCIPALDFTLLKKQPKICIAPPLRKKRGRPKMNRIPSRGETSEKGSKYHCRRCHKSGHNIRSCPENQ